MSLHTKAQKLFDLKKFEEALQVYNEAIAESQDQPDLFHDRGVCFFHLGKMEDALQDMDTALDLQPEYSYRYASRAFIKSAMKDTESAIADYRKAIELDPEDAISQNNLGLLEEKLGYMDLAKQRFEKADGLAGLLKNTGVSQSEDTVNKSIVSADESSDEQENKSHLKNITREAFSVFRSKSQFKEYLNFIRKGFRK